MAMSRRSAEADGVPNVAEIQSQAVALLRNRLYDDAAALLAACRMVLDFTNTVAGEPGEQGSGLFSVEIELAVTPAAALWLRDARDVRTQASRTVLREVLPSTTWIDGIVVTASEPDAATQPAESSTTLPVASTMSTPLASPHLPHATATAHDDPGINQAVSTQALQEWNGLRFRSHSEVCIARALDRAGALFFPQCQKASWRRCQTGES
jgi:hypothetical protein